MTRVCLMCDSPSRAVYIIVDLLNESVEIAPYNKATHDTPGIVVLCSADCLREWCGQLDNKRFKVIKPQFNEKVEAADLQAKRLRDRRDSDAAGLSKRPRNDLYS